MQKKNLSSYPDETRLFEMTKIEPANFDDVTRGRAILETGWSREKCVKPIIKTNICQASHTQRVISGRLRAAMDDGIEEELGPRDTVGLQLGMTHGLWEISP